MRSPGSRRLLRWRLAQVCIQNDEFRIQNDGLCIQNDECCITGDLLRESTRRRTSYLLMLDLDLLMLSGDVSERLFAIRHDQKLPEVSKNDEICM